jgi:hypothetical protein
MNTNANCRLLVPPKHDMLGLAGNDASSANHDETQYGLLFQVGDVRG